MARRKRSESTASSASASSLSSKSSISSVPPKKHSKKATRPKKKHRSSDDDEKRTRWVNSFPTFWSLIMIWYRNKEADSIDPHEEFLAAARCIARCIDVFCKTKQLISVGLALQQHDAAEHVSEDEDLRATLDKRLSKMWVTFKFNHLLNFLLHHRSSKVKDRYRKNYAQLLELAPSLKTLLGDHRKTAELNVIIKKVSICAYMRIIYTDFIHQMDTVISATRSDDTSRLKSQIGHYAAFNTKDHPIRPAIYDGSGSRTHMGINHPVLARFLCPVRELKAFSEDADQWVFVSKFTSCHSNFERALKNIQCGKVSLTASALPAFLWAGDPPGSNYDDDNMFQGMFEGYLLERVRVLFNDTFIYW